MTTPPAFLKDHAALYADDPRQACRQWLKDARYGLFIHYGLYSLLGRHEWVQQREKLYVAEVAKLAQRFTAEKFDADHIVDFAIDCGMKYINLTTRHHDSFCLFKTAQTEFSSDNAPHCRRDLVGELANACDKRGIGLCLYYSHGRDWRHPHAPNNDQFDHAARPEYDPPEPSYAYGKDHDLNQYLDFMSAQITELLTQYSPIAAIWLDGIATPLHPKDEHGNVIQGYDPRRDGDPFKCQQLYDLIHSLSPYVLVSYKQGYLHTEDFYAPENKAIDQPGKLIEICATMMPGSWGHTLAHDGNHRSADEVWEQLRIARRKNCNLLLNTGPLPDGSIHPEDNVAMRAVGKRLREEGFPQ